MGTRNLTMVIKSGRTRVAQYGQWDGYPEGQGTTILNFLRECNMERFKKRIETGVRFLNPSDVKERKEFLTSIGATDGWLNMNQSSKYNKKFPYDSRDHGGEILQLIYDADDKVVLQNSASFAQNGLFCEWAYVVNLDTMKLEVYNGFRKSAVEGSRFGDKLQDHGYMPVQPLMEFDLNNLPTEEEFVSQLTVEDEDEDDE